MKMRSFDETAALHDICFVLNVNSRGWILEKICRVIESASGSVCFYLFSERNDKLSYPLPAARNYFFAHFALAVAVMKNYPDVKSANCFVWYTHPDLSKGVTKDDLVNLAAACTLVFTPCSLNRETLVEWGAQPNNIMVPLGGADPAHFQPKTRTGDGAIGFVGAYYERKQPEKMLEIAYAMPDKKVILVGPRAEDVENASLVWHHWERFQEFQSLPNVEYIEAHYDDFPQHYRSFDVYCSTSLLEGGPIPAIEAMMSNVVPVISDTGFARDIISHGRNGYIFHPSSASEDIISLIRQALANTETDIAASAARFSWEEFGSAIWRGIRGDIQRDQKVSFHESTSAARYLTRGFHPVEQRGVWMRAAEAELTLPVAENFEPKEIEFFLWIPAEGGETSVTMQFYVGGKLAATHEVTARAATYRIPVNAGYLTDRRVFRVRIETSRLFKKEDWPSNATEKRSLGAKIGWVRVR
ncbi:glycosyltransferase family 4 protein [Muricoccus aerilatus]|uniref:glycosyltransferase family 4 protein n=1 Tax=Muricoccus aerilatus TaxID=452982 RepID=UPI00146FCFA1|nr:glycosyltransferase family 4 protein [Roseomonas aerilata]